MMENLLSALGKTDENKLSQACLVGVLSLMDVVFQIEMKQLLKDLAIDDEISNSILKGEGLQGQLLKLVIACERQEFDLVSALLDHLKISQDKFGEILVLSYSNSEIEV